MLTKASLTAETLASVLEQSVDCVKLISLAGEVVWMNPNGLCALEIDEFSSVEGVKWSSLWPEAVRPQIAAAYAEAASGKTVRFSAPCPTVKGTPRTWEVSVSGVTGSGGALAGYMAISRDVSEAERDREALRILAEEMRHRLKNSYTIVCSLMRGIARGTPEHEAFAADMDDRITALATAQSLFDGDDRPTSLQELAHALIDPFGTPGCAFTLDVADDCHVGKRPGDAIALVVGELAVNSGKHGALKHGGSVTLAGDCGDGAMWLEWSEHSAVPVIAHSRDGGQGLTLIRRIVIARRGELTVEWRESGLFVRLNLPLD